jgi:hypothetical protein
MPGMGYEVKEIVLDAGDSALFYSDGLVEAHEPKGEMFGFPRLRALVAKHDEEGALGTSSWKSFTPSWGRAGSRRTTSPSLRYDVLGHESELRRIHLPRTPVNRGRGDPPSARGPQCQGCSSEAQHSYALFPYIIDS